ncbi:hypothetical protein R4P47_01585 [Rhodococcus sp. IEGM 1370]|uniref:hypothetical protein n=1 Tax=Rhodococcus sp. IEGM 1370 TaxID=3082222 RepID=UPI002952FB0C|nr:hypothetical protein [Rhodococcus sp. IEGM 1370]MDV8075233.1 hypothetical protein [Rhodococcus sp. IEGM 1370]
MAEEYSTRPLFRNGAGSAAVILGIIALVCAFVPFIGDFVAVPTGVAAVVCGWVGVSRDEKGLATNGREAMIGAALGGAAVFVAYAATIV